MNTADGRPMNEWQPNPGRPPVFTPRRAEPCPADRVLASDAEKVRVHVRLRNGREATWPLLGRPVPTRWSLTGCGFDIMFWKRA